MAEYPITIVGCGPGHRDYVTPAACAPPTKNQMPVCAPPPPPPPAAAKAEVLVGAPHLLQLFDDIAATRISVDRNITALLDTVQQHRQRQVVVLVSGDCGLYSLAHSVQKRFGADNCRLIPGISSLQVACARLGLPWQDTHIISAHGRTPQIDIQHCRRAAAIAVLAGNPAACACAAALLDELGSAYRAWSCEDLTLAQERVRPCSSEQLRNETFSSRTIIIMRRDGEQQ